MNRIGHTLLFEAAQHVSGQQAFEAGPGSGPYGDENLGKPLRGRCLIWGSTVSGQITELLVRQHGVSAAVIDNRQQNACFYAAKHGHSQLPLDSNVLGPWGISSCWMLAGCPENQCLLDETLLLNVIDCISYSTSCPFPQWSEYVLRCEFLIASGCSVSHTDTSGQTPVFYSVRAGHVTQLKEQVCAMHQKTSLLGFCMCFCCMIEYFVGLSLGDLCSCLL